MSFLFWLPLLLSIGFASLLLTKSGRADIRSACRRLKDSNSRKIYHRNFHDRPTNTQNSFKYMRGESWNVNGSWIETRRGLYKLWRRSAIYGPAAKGWEIVGVSLGNNPQGGFGDEWVHLADKQGIHAERHAVDSLLRNYPDGLQTVIDDLGRVKTDLRESQSQNEGLQKLCTEQKSRIEQLLISSEAERSILQAIVQVISEDHKERPSRVSKLSRGLRNFLEQQGGLTFNMAGLHRSTSIVGLKAQLRGHIEMSD